MLRTLVIFCTLLLLWHIVAELNHALAPLHAYVFAGGLFVAYAALRLPLRSGLAATLLAGLLCDSGIPREDLGMHVILFAAAHAALFHLRDRIPRDDTLGRIAVVLLVNLALFLPVSFYQIADSPAPAAVWPRLLADLLWSQLFLTVVTPWFLALQERSLVIAGAERESLA